MKRLTAVLAALVLIGGVSTLNGLEKKSKKDSLMRKKLAHAQKVLEGIAVADFKMIARNAEDLIAISKTAEWRAFRSPRYEVFSNDFRRTADKLVKKAEEKNLDGAALTYLELTLTCVNCHKHVREVRMTRN
jgi:hypothetical protein